MERVYSYNPGARMGPLVFNHYSRSKWVPLKNLLGLLVQSHNTGYVLRGIYFTVTTEVLRERTE